MAELTDEQVDAEARRRLPDSEIVRIAKVRLSVGGPPALSLGKEANSALGNIGQEDSPIAKGVGLVKDLTVQPFLDLAQVAETAMDQEKWDKLSPGEQRTLLTKMASGIITAIPGGRIGRGVGQAVGIGREAGGVLGGALGSSVGSEMIGQQVGESTGDVPRTSMWDKTKRAGMATAQGVVGSSIVGAAGTATKHVSNFGERVLGMFNSDVTHATAAKSPAAIVKRHLVGIANTGQEREFFADLKEGVDALMEERPWVGAKDLDTYHGNIETRLKARAQTREELVQRATQVLTDQNKNLGLGGPDSNVRYGSHLPPLEKFYGEQLNKLARESDSGYSQMSAQDREGILNLIREKDFKTAEGHPIEVTPAYLFDKLQNVYETLRILRTYDDAQGAQMVRNQGQAGAATAMLSTDGPNGGPVNVGIAREVLTAYAQGLKSALNEGMRRVIKDNPDAFGRDVRPDAFEKATNAYAGLRPFRDAVERMIRIEGASEGPNAPNSLLNQGGMRNEGNSAMQAVNMAVDETVGPLMQNYKEQRMLRGPSESMEAISRIGDFATGEGSIMPPRAMATGVAQLGSAIGGGVEALSRTPVVSSALSLASASQTPLYVDEAAFFQGDPNELKSRIAQTPIPDEAKQVLIAASNGNAGMKRQALGKAKMILAEQGIPFFSPTQIPGYNSYVSGNGGKGGYITDQYERTMFAGEVMNLYKNSDPRKAHELTRMLAVDGYIPYIPDELKRAEPSRSVVVPLTPPQVRSKVTNRISGTVETDVGERTDPGH